jgi:hypothetical protein
VPEADPNFRVILPVGDYDIELLDGWRLAVFPHAGHVAFDVAGLQGRAGEGRIEQLDQREISAHEALVHGLERRAGADRRYSKAIRQSRAPVR